MGATLQEAEVTLTPIGNFADSFAKAGNVVLPILFTLGEPRGKPTNPFPTSCARTRLRSGQERRHTVSTSGVEVPVVRQPGRSRAGVGHLNAVPDVDGAIRTEALAITYYDEFFPSLAAMLVAKSLNLTAKDIKIAPAKRCRSATSE